MKKKHLIIYNDHELNDAIKELKQHIDAIKIKNKLNINDRKKIQELDDILNNIEND